MSDQPNSVKWATIDQAVAQLGISRRTLFRRLRAGQINSIQASGKRLVEVRPMQPAGDDKPVETRLGMLALTKSNEQLQTALAEARTAWRDAETRNARAQSAMQSWAVLAAVLALAAGVAGTMATWQWSNASSATGALLAATNSERQMAQTVAQARAETETQREIFSAILAGWVDDSLLADTSASIGTVTPVDCLQD